MLGTRKDPGIYDFHVLGVECGIRRLKVEVPSLHDVHPAGSCNFLLCIRAALQRVGIIFRFSYGATLLRTIMQVIYRKAVRGRINVVRGWEKPLGLEKFGGKKKFSGVDKRLPL